MEVQSHGNDYEDFVIKRLTGKSKKEDLYVNRKEDYWKKVK